MFSKLFLLAVVTVSAWATDFQTRLINGTPVDPGSYKEVVRLKAQGFGCTATVVGKRAIVTAAHCAADGASVTFDVGGVPYAAKIFRSPLYPKEDHDISLAITEKDIDGVPPATVGGKADKGLKITLLGFGCSQAGGGASDGQLRKGDTVVTNLVDLDMVTFQQGGAALCFGDSGGPAFVTDASNKRLLLGINSKGNITDTNYHTRTDIEKSITFLKQTSEANGVTICGINAADCGGVTPPAPTCSLSANPSTVQPNGNVMLTLNVTAGSATSATIEGAAVTLSGTSAQKTITAGGVGTYTVKGTVTGQGGTSSCSTQYSVVEGPAQPPTCSLSVSPQTIKVGQSTTATLTVTGGQATSATIDGSSVNPSGGSLQLPAATSAGMKSVKGVVSGPGGSSNCSASYKVEGEDPGPITDFFVVPTHCGTNQMMETKVRDVCMALVTYSYARRDVAIKEGLVVTYSDGSKEFMPIILRQLGKRQPKNEAEIYEELTFYANAMDEVDGKYKVRKREGLLKTNGQGEPTYVQGHTASQPSQFFMVPNLKKVTP